MRNLCFVLVALLCLNCSGNKDPFMSDSNGRAYSVVIISEDSLARGIIGNVLETDVEGLPQREPSFDVTFASELDAPLSKMRNIIVVTCDSSHKAKTQIKYEKNAFAEPQMLIHITTPTAEKLGNDMKTSGKRLLNLLEKSEMNAAIRSLKRRHLQNQERMIREMLDAEILIPEGLSSSKRGKDFVWLSNNAATSMQNICVYAYEGTATDRQTFIHKRDSIMRANIQGEREGMWMTTIKESITLKQEMQNNNPISVIRGLWEMKGDMMGGPFVAHAMADHQRERTIVAEAFVYAPVTDKRNQIRQLEAALYTLLLYNRTDDGK